MNVGIDHDTAEFSVESIRRWWREMGKAMYQRPSCLLISRQVVVNLIGSTTTQEGLRIKTALDEKSYTPGIKIADEELATLA